MPLAILAAVFDRLGCYEPAATFAGFAISPLTIAALPELSLGSPTCAMSSATRATNHLPARATQ